MTGVRAVIGVPLYGDGRFLDEALDSLRAQCLAGIRFALVDDGLAPDAAARATAVAAADSRFSYERNPERLGMLPNWHRAFHRALALAPGAEYFAWASDHDVWHPRWASALVAALDVQPDAVAAHPLRWVIGEDGEVSRFSGRFCTPADGGAVQRFLHANRHMSAGNLVYSLFRIRALEAAGVYRPVLLPDRLLMLELALEGQLVEHPEVLWLRRTWAKATVDRQKATLWAAAPPPYAEQPWWRQHANVLADRLVRRPHDVPVRRATGGLLVCAVLVEGVRREHAKRLRERLWMAFGPLRIVRKRTKKFVVHHVTMPLGAWRRRMWRSMLDGR